MEPITKEKVQEILDKYPQLFDERGTINPQGLVSGVSSAANPHDGRTITFDEFESRLEPKNHATFQEQSVGEIPSKDDKKVLFHYLQQQHGVKPTFASLSEFKKAHYASEPQAKPKPAKTARKSAAKKPTKGGSRKKTRRRKSNRRRNKTSRRS